MHYANEIREERYFVGCFTLLCALAFYLAGIHEPAAAETFPPCAHPTQPAFLLVDEATGDVIEAESFAYQPDARTLRYRPRECLFSGSFE